MNPSPYFVLQYLHKKKKPALRHTEQLPIRKTELKTNDQKWIYQQERKFCDLSKP